VASFIFIKKLVLIKMHKVIKLNGCRACSTPTEEAVPNKLGTEAKRSTKGTELQMSRILYVASPKFDLIHHKPVQHMREDREKFGFYGTH
jgi:hypothetical protein